MSRLSTSDMVYTLLSIYTPQSVAGMIKVKPDTLSRKLRGVSPWSPQDTALVTLIWSEAEASITILTKIRQKFT